MRSNYRRIGDYIQEVTLRNTELKVTNLLGININKFFMPSVANVVGTDMSKYKVVKKRQFACNRMHVGRDKRLPVALWNEVEDIIVSPAYNVFEVIDENLLYPEYLMMWFSRSEFDRNAWFYTDADVRGGLSWNDFCDIELPVPSIEKQREIVKEYKVLQDRISLNNKLIEKLEDTAQAIYKQWFVDFDFPDENGNPYKSSGGEMSYYYDIDEEIPKGWIKKPIGSDVILSQGLAINKKTDYLITDNGIPLLRITDLINDTEEIYIDKSVSQKNIASEEDIIITRTGQVGLVFRNKKGVLHNNCFKVTPSNDAINNNYLYWFLKRESTRYAMIELASGSAQLDLTHGAFFTLPILIPTKDIQMKFSNMAVKLECHIRMLNVERRKLNEIVDILLSKMIKVEG